MILGCRALYPKQIQHKFVKGLPVDEEHDLTSGYVFLYIEDSADQPESELLRLLPGFIRILRNSDGSALLRGDDEAFAAMLLNNNGIIGRTLVYEEGDIIKLKDDAFSGFETKILKLDRRKHRMQIEIPFANSTIKTWVEYELVEKA
ncbi:MAG: hypothetical protein IKZ82_08790 [Clostridia bacterium]|nr:hypothetical protein [Clostridia bacterium]